MKSILSKIVINVRCPAWILEINEKAKTMNLCLSATRLVHARTCPHAWACALTTALALTGVLALTGCDQIKQLLPGITPSPPSPVDSTLKWGGKQYREPALTGKVIDAVTKQPIHGAVVYGFYATSGGGTLAGGTLPGEHVKSFEADTDANGLFTLPAWDSGEQAVKGETGTRFPALAIYKPGYDIQLTRLSSIKQWQPDSSDPLAKPEIKNNTLDWTKFPHEMRAVTTELERYNALDNGGVMMQLVGECGWESYAKTLLVRHTEWKAFLKRNIPPEHLDANGYSKGTYGHPDANLRSSLSGKSTADNILDQYKKAKSTWKCADPSKLIAGAN